MTTIMIIPCLHLDYPKLNKMDSKIDYLVFMQWFQNNHPDLYACCWKDIIPPNAAEGVTLNKDGMDTATYHRVIQATQEYYHEESK